MSTRKPAATSIMAHLFGPAGQYEVGTTQRYRGLVYKVVSYKTASGVKHRWHATRKAITAKQVRTCEKTCTGWRHPRELDATGRRLRNSSVALRR